MQSSRSPFIIVGAIALVASVIFWAVSMPSHAHAASAPLTSTMGIGARGDQVSQLQSFLSASPDVYPQAIVSGYYGGLTQSAVSQFQAFTDLPVVGRVGPLTLARMNAVIATGMNLDVSAPTMSAVAVNQSNNSATLSWNTGENSTSRVFYSTSPLSVQEATANFTAPLVSGQVADNGAVFSTSHAVTVSGLTPNTVYYYSVMSIDQSGNVSMTWPAMFITHS